ncbi:MAG: hypothetical protein L0338_39745, partial [Acidobacteria bacterium]|nr:hypothetical protein [Acidobacteriota bacterium]
MVTPPRPGQRVQADVLSRTTAPYGTELPREIPLPPVEGIRPQPFRIPGVGQLPSPEQAYAAVAGPGTLAGTLPEQVTPQGFQRQQAMQAPLVDLSQFAPEDQPLIQGLAQGLSSFTSPENVMFLAGTGALGRLAKGPIGRAVSLGFTADILSQFPDEARAFSELLNTGQFDEAERLVGEMMVQGAFAGLAGAHAAFGGKPPRYRKGMLPDLVERMRPARIPEVVAPEPRPVRGALAPPREPPIIEIEAEGGRPRRRLLEEAPTVTPEKPVVPEPIVPPGGVRKKGEMAGREIYSVDVAGGRETTVTIPKGGDLAKAVEEARARFAPKEPKVEKPELAKLRGEPVRDLPGVYDIGPGMGGRSYNVAFPNGQQTTVTVSDKPGAPGLKQKVLEAYQKRGLRPPEEFQPEVPEKTFLPAEPLKPKPKLLPEPKVEAPRTQLLARIDAALERMKAAGQHDTESYRNLESKRNAIAEGKPYKIEDVTEKVIGAAGAEIGKLT